MRRRIVKKVKPRIIKLQLKCLIAQEPNLNYKLLKTETTSLTQQIHKDLLLIQQKLFQNNKIYQHQVNLTLTWVNQVL